MATITFNVNPANLTLLKESLAFHQGRDAADVTTVDVKAWLEAHANGLVRKYREHRREVDNPVDLSKVLT